MKVSVQRRANAVDIFLMPDIYNTPLGPILFQDGQPVCGLRGRDNAMRMLGITRDILLEYLQDLDSAEAEHLAIEALFGPPALA